MKAFASLTLEISVWNNCLWPITHGCGRSSVSWEVFFSGWWFARTSYIKGVREMGEVCSLTEQRGAPLREALFTMCHLLVSSRKAEKDRTCMSATTAWESKPEGAFQIGGSEEEEVSPAWSVSTW